MTTIEHDLKALLEERASSHDVRAAVPPHVARRARAYRAATGAAAGALVAAVVAVALVAPGRLTSAERVRPVAPSPNRELVEGGGFVGGSHSGPGFDARRADIVATGRVGDGRWALSADRQAAGECLTLEVPRMSSSSCGNWADGDERDLEVAGRARVHGAATLGVFGYATPRVERVTVTTASGVTVRAELAPTGARLPRPAQMWVAFVPRGDRMTVVAEDERGRTLVRKRLSAYAAMGAP